ncbi:MAG: YggT family protein [Clostridia bacterium]
MGNMLSSLIAFYQMVLLVRAITSWFPDVQRSKVGQFIYSITEPVLAPVRNFIRSKLNLGGLPIDISFLVVYFGLDIIAIFLRYYI